MAHEYEYDLIVIGSGSAGLVAASFAGRMGLKTALIEKRPFLGGDCTWYGCVPSKALLHVAKTAHAARSGAKYGIAAAVNSVDMQKVHDYVHDTISRVYEHETPEVITDRGVDVILGTAEFTGTHTVKITLNDDAGEKSISGNKFVIATGASPFVPPIEGLDTVDYHTNLTLFDNKELPESMVTIGGGPIGMEMSQAYSRLGAKVTVVTERIMMNDDLEVAEHIKKVFQDEGVQFVMGHVTKVVKEGDKTCVYVGEQRVAADLLLVATGRRPHVNGMNLEAAGVKYTARGIQVDENLRTSQEHIYAAGDVTGGMQFTHYAGFQGSIAARNALLPGSSKGTTEVLPWTTFTEPEIAHVGLTEQMAEEKLGKGNFETRIFSMGEGDRAQAEDDMDGFVKIIHDNGKLLGATVVSKRAGETINEYAMVMQDGGGVGDLSNTIHSYPTYGQISANFASKMKVERLLNSTGFKVYTKVRDTLGL